MVSKEVAGASHLNCPPAVYRNRDTNFHLFLFFSLFQVSGSEQRKRNSQLFLPIQRNPPGYELPSQRMAVSGFFFSSLSLESTVAITDWWSISFAFVSTMVTHRYRHRVAVTID